MPSGPPGKASQVTALELIECVQAEDLSTSEGKKALYGVLTLCGSYWKRMCQTRRVVYRSKGFGVGEANRLAGLDVAAALPTAKDLPDGMLESLRGDSDDEPTAGPTGEIDSPYDCLKAEVRKVAAGKRVGIAQRVNWVVENIGFGVAEIDAESVPSMGTLFMWNWARKSGQENTFRRDFEAKLIPTRGIAESEEKGFIDSGEPIDDIIQKIGVGVGRAIRSSIDGQVRHLQIGKIDGDNVSQERRVHGLPESSDGGRSGDSPGQAWGPGSDADAGAGVGIPAQGAESVAGRVPSDDTTNDPGSDAAQQGADEARPRTAS